MVISSVVAAREILSTCQRILNATIPHVPEHYDGLVFIRLKLEIIDVLLAIEQRNLSSELSNEEKDQIKTIRYKETSLNEIHKLIDG